jgi:2-polyprenyl-6-methoxyphenol hydroxylase-like FAD-dependent oxidoreductase
MHDVIVVGARCAGAPTAMLLARKGYKVLLVDRATFPSDTISTHLLWPHGAEILGRWGLLDRLAATGLRPICRKMSFDLGPLVLTGTVPDANDGDGGYCPRRTVLDHLLVDAAAEAGADVRTGVIVEQLLEEGGKVVGIRGRTETGTSIEERARVVIGADGAHSLVARLVHAPEYDARPVMVCAYYSYFSDVQQDDLELYTREHRAFGSAPTNAGLHLVMVNWPTKDFPEVRSDIEGHFWRSLDMAPGLAQRVRAGRRQEKWYGIAGVPNYFRKPYGEGWALVGDASYCRDPITAQGISDAFIDAEGVAEAIDAGLSGRAAFDRAFAEHESSRNERVRPMYEFTLDFAALEPPPPHMQQLFGALQGNQDATNAFFSAITGAISLRDFMSPENLGRIMNLQNQ